ncbi:MAG TPA: hypothetical protein VJ785_17015 [Anaerolineales bacterium]|nr:hypothetical protein [Anaerolineales bacterium]
MNLIDRYVAEVGRHLPEKDRSDIEAEIRSNIEDMIEERGQSAMNPADEKIIVETLEELGDPRLLAAKYAPPKRYLIGPEWYEGYLIVLRRILFTALPIVAVVTFVLALSNGPLDFIGAVGDAVVRVFSIGMQILFWVTLVFVLLERSGEKPNDLPKPGSRQWSVDQLPASPRRRQISVVESMMNIALLLFVLIWIALPTVLARLEGDTAPMPFLNPDLWNFWLPLLFVIIGLTLVHEIFKLKIGNWTRPLIITNVILCLTTIIYIIALITTQDVINPAFVAALASGMTSTELENVTTWATWSVNLTAVIIIGIYIWDMVDSIRRSRQLEPDPYMAVAMRKI